VLCKAFWLVVVAVLLLVAAFINCCLIGSLIARLIELHCLVCSFHVEHVR